MVGVVVNGLVGVCGRGRDVNDGLTDQERDVLMKVWKKQ